MNNTTDTRVAAAASLLFLVLAVAPALAEGEELDYDKNKFSVLFGVTHDNERRHNGVTLGLEYERLLSESFGVGGVVERVAGDLDFWIYGVPFFYHVGRWKFLVAPAVEDSDAHGQQLMLRVGADYEFEVGGWGIGPGVDVDFVDGDQVLVVGFVIGKGF